jgi:molecular chaperone GrpE
MGNQAEEKDMNQNEEMVSENTAEVADNLPESSAEETKNAKEEQGDVAKLQSELAEQKDKYIRLYSEFDNFRRRTAKEKLEMIQSANEQLLKALLPVIDDFERAEKSFKDKDSGSEFNPDLHEAITQIPAPDEKLKGKIVDVVERGYLLNEKVIRFAKVVVGS